MNATTCCDSISLPFMLSLASAMPFTFSAIATRVSWISFLRDFTASFVAFSRSSTIESRASCASTALFRIFTVSLEIDFNNWISSGAPVVAWEACRKELPGTSRQRRNVSTTFAKIFSIMSWLESTVLNRAFDARISSVTRFSSSSIVLISSCMSFRLAFSCWFSALRERTSACNWSMVSLFSRSSRRFFSFSELHHSFNPASPASFALRAAMKPSIMRFTLAMGSIPVDA
mmetsp:Transcript_11880/g.28259  ORF Transcript_11880/g.28259 Transcript_11880/m.28259 type:complete len:231 (-) Transcript_11880:66-758(-)